MNICQAILTSLGGQLRKLVLRHSREAIIDLDHLVHCKKLEELCIWNCKGIVKTGVKTLSLQAKEFLPRLKKLSTSCCLRQGSRLFEVERPALSNVDLQCSHFGISSATDCNLCDLPQLWPNLKELNLGESKPF